MKSSIPDTVRIALPSKGHLYDGSLDQFKAAGYAIRRASDRQYEATIANEPRFHVVFMRPTDIVEQVREGRCHLGVTGMDVYAEHAGDGNETLVITEDLGYGGCRLTVAVPESWIDVGHMLDLVDLTQEFKDGGKSFRVSTKYPTLVRGHFRKWGVYHYQVIPSDGALELHPSLGIADIIVDLTSSGTTLKDNRLREIEQGTVLKSAACLIGHRESLRNLVSEGDSGVIGRLLDAFDAVRDAREWLHIEVVGEVEKGKPTDTRAADVASLLQLSGARHVCRGDVWDAANEPAWRITGLIRVRELVACRRLLSSRGAVRAVAVPARFVFDRDSPSTLDRIRTEVC